MLPALIAGPRIEFQRRASATTRSAADVSRTLLDGHPVELTDANFDQVVAASELPVVVDFWAPWCGPCRQMAPQFEQAAGSLKGKALLVKVNSDDNPRTAGRFGIRSIPTLLKLRGGAEVARVAGARPAAQIVQFAQS